MKIAVLGSGAWLGIPAPFCKCRVCTEATENPKSHNARQRPQFVVEKADAQFLIELSPDFRLQSRDVDENVAGAIISHWHFDHMGGLRELHTYSKSRGQNKLRIHGSTGTKEMLDQEYAYLPIEVEVHEAFATFELAGVKITPLPVYHMRNIDDGVPEDKLANTFGFLLEDGGVKVAYMADYYRIPETTLKLIEGVDILIADGTYLLTEKYRDIKPNHIHGKDILEFTQGTGAKKVYFHSISHLTGHDHDELQAQLPENHFLSFDGLELLS